MSKKLTSLVMVFALILGQVPPSFAADTMPPSPPTNLTATAISSSQINLSWNASTDNVGVAGYKIYRDDILRGAIDEGGGTSYSDTGLTASTAYSYTISAYDAAGNESEKSTSASTTTLTPGSFIPAPTSAVGRGLHPRLYFSKDDIPTLELRTRTTHATQYSYLKQHADAIIDVYGNPTDDDNMYNGRSLIPVYAFIALMEKEKGNSYSQYVTVVKNYARLNLSSGYGSFNDSLMGNIIHNLAIAYDWLYDELTPTERQQYVDKIIDAMSKWNDETLVFKRPYYQSWWFVYFGKIPMGALSFYGDGYRQADAQTYLDLGKRFVDDLVTSSNDIGHEGGWAEGFAYLDVIEGWYWPAGVGTHAAIFKIWKTATGINRFPEANMLKNYASYIQYSIRPKDGTLQKTDESASYFGPTMLYPNHYRSWVSLLANEYSQLGETDAAGRHQWLAQKETPYDSYIYSTQNRKSLWDIIWYDPNITPIPPDNTLPKTKIFMDNGFVIMRDGFTSPSDFYATFSNKDFYIGHQHNDNNTFTLDYNGAALVIDSGYYDGWGGVNSQGYYHRTTAHNSILVVDPNKWLSGSIFDEREGGQYSGKVLGDVNDVKTEGTMRDIASMKTDITSNYDYIWGDATDAYKALPGYKTPAQFENYNQLNNFTRQFVRLKPNNYIVILDRVSAKDPSFQKKWLLHTLEEPEINGSVVDTEVAGHILSYNGDMVKITKDNGRLFHKVLLPTSYKIRKVGGSGYEFWRDDAKQNYAPNPTRVNPARPSDLPIDGWEMGKWRYEIWPTLPQNDDLFLNVLEPTGSTTPTMVANQRIDASSGNMVGALIQDPTNPYVVMFSKTEIPQSSVTYDANYSASLTGKHLLADMSFGTYDIYKNGVKVLSGITASSQGTLYFESTGGSTFQVVKTGEVPLPTDTTPPSTPTNLTATAISSSQINLSWTASTDNTAVTGYKIYRCAGSACAPTVQIATSAANSYSNTGLTASTAYTYAVSAYDAAGNESSRSASVNATTQAKPTGIIFEDSFDNSQNWSSSLVYGKGEVWPDTIQTVLDGPGSTAKSPDWYSYRVAPISNLSGKPLYAVDNIDSHGSVGKSFKYNIERNSYMNGGGMDLYLGGGKTGGYEEIYIRTYIKFEEGFDFQNGGSQFMKLFRLYTGVDPDTDNLGPASTFATSEDYNATPKIKRSMNAYLDIVSDGNEDQRLKFAYFLGQKDGVDYIEINKVFPAATFNFKDYSGQWIYMEWYAKLNTVGQANGEMKVWIAPESSKSSIDQANPTASWTGLEIRSATDRKFNTVIMADNMSGQWERPVSEQTISWDDLVVSTAFVGPDYRSNSATGIIFEDSFDNYNWSSTSAYGTSVSGKAITPFNLTADFSKPGWATYRQSSTANQVGDPVWAVTQEAGHSGGKSLKYELENTAPGFWNGGGLNLYLGGPDNSVSGYKELYISAWTKFEDNFILPTTGYMMKLLRVYYGVNADIESGDVSSPLDSNNKWKLSSYVDYIGNNYMLLREIQFPSNRIPNGQPFPAVGNADSPIFTDYKTWKRVMYHIKLNTYGNSDGLLELYINDAKVASLNNVELVNPAEGNIENNKINVINIPDNYYEMAQGMPLNLEVAFYIDDLVISTDYVPLDYVPVGSSSPDTQAPTIPAGLTATAVSSSQINLSWSASTDDAGVTGYKIYRCAGSACAPTTQIATSATNSYSNTGLTASTTYTYAISAYDATGNESGKSSSVSATTKAPADTSPPVQPRGLRIK